MYNLTVQKQYFWVQISVSCKKSFKLQETIKLTTLSSKVGWHDIVYNHIFWVQFKVSF